MEIWEIMNRLKREHIYLIFIILIIICIFQYGIHKICGFTIYPDELENLLGLKKGTFDTQTPPPKVNLELKNNIDN